MKLFWPRSILQLTIIGFLTVITPLIAALLLVAQQLNALGDLSQSSISEVAQAMRISRLLIEQTSAMERNARQYSVLNDEELLKVYMSRRQEFIKAIDVLEDLDIGGDIKPTILQLVSNEKMVFNILQRTPEKIVASSAELPVLMTLSHQISQYINEWTDRQVIMLKQQTDHTLQLLHMEALILISTALILAGMFTVLITRPLRQIDRAIHQLGSGSYENSIQVQGPYNLRELGVRLDWLRNRLKELEQQRTRMLQHLSHELKTPLTALQEGVSLLNEGLVGTLTKQQAEVTGILRNNCRRLQHLIENLLRFRMNNPEGVYSMPLPVRFDMVINQAIIDQALPVKASKLDISRQLEKLIVYGDEEQLRAVVDNLLTNAVRYSPVGGTIYVRLMKDNGHATLHVFDEGKGILPVERDLVFEAFYQGRPPDRGHMNGTGLGLTIAAEYTRMNRGTIEILDSDRGAHFQVRIPLAQEALIKYKEERYG